MTLTAFPSSIKIKTFKRSSIVSNFLGPGHVNSQIFVLFWKFDICLIKTLLQCLVLSQSTFFKATRLSFLSTLKIEILLNKLAYLGLFIFF